MLGLLGYKTNPPPAGKLSNGPPGRPLMGSAGFKGLKLLLGNVNSLIKKPDESLITSPGKPDRASAPVILPRVDKDTLLIVPLLSFVNVD